MTNKSGSDELNKLPQTMKNTLTQKDLANRWGCGSRTVRRRAKEFGLCPVDYTGKVPLFEPADVERMEARRKAALLNRGGYGPGPSSIITIKQAKRLARGQK
jgi:hypothetical protein